MEKPGEMNTLSQVMEKLRQKGYDTEFRMTPEGFTDQKGKYYEAEDLQIIKAYRFEGDSNPSDSSVLYIIETNDGLIGYSLNAYGTYEDSGEEYNNFLRNVSVEERDDELLFVL